MAGRPGHTTVAGPATPPFTRPGRSARRPSRRSPWRRGASAPPAGGAAPSSSCGRRSGRGPPPPWPGPRASSGGTTWTTCCWACCWRSETPRASESPGEAVHTAVRDPTVHCERHSDHSAHYNHQRQHSKLRPSAATQLTTTFTEIPAHYDRYRDPSVLRLSQRPQPTRTVTDTPAYYDRHNDHTAH